MGKSKDQSGKSKRTVRQYSVFCKIGGKWTRLYPTAQFPKAQAVRVFQGTLLSLSLAGKAPELRPVASRD